MALARGLLSDVLLNSRAIYTYGRNVCVGLRRTEVLKEKLILVHLKVHIVCMLWAKRQLLKFLWMLHK
jgi:hypothetical protein